MLFGGKKRAERRRHVEAETERLAALSPPELAAAVMVAGWGPDGPPQLHGGRLNKFYVIRALAPAKPDIEAHRRLEQLCDEGLAALERAGLLVSDLSHGGERQVERWRPTRAGIEALERATVRERVAEAQPDTA